ncbi:AAA family ATPase [Mesoterricola silvestris]|nr:AAA family ATPase [Mesoterricola silvestris]
MPPITDKQAGTCSAQIAGKSAGRRDPKTEAWLSCAGFIARECNLRSVSSAVLAAALDAVGLLADAGLEAPSLPPHWYLAFMEVGSRWSAGPRTAMKGLEPAENLPPGLFDLMGRAHALGSCVLEFLRAQDPVWVPLFWPESAKGEDPDAPRKRLQRAGEFAARVERKLLASLVGQTEAVDALKKLAFQVALRKGPSGPPPLALFLGPPGVGKSMAGELFGQALAEWQGEEEPSLIRIDLTQYTQWSSGSDLWGGSGRYGSVPPRVQSHPRSVLLVEELEKAHVKCLESFLPILGTGKLERETGKPVDFSGTVFIFTSNLGSELWGRREAAETGPFSMDLSDLMGLHGTSGERSDWMKAAIPRELLSRLAQGHLVLFHAHEGHHHLDLIDRFARKED